MARGMQDRKKRPTQVIPTPTDSETDAHLQEDAVQELPAEQDTTPEKVTLSLQVRHVEILEDFIYHARKAGLKTNKSEVIRLLIELLPAIDTENHNYENMEEVRDILLQALHPMP